MDTKQKILKTALQLFTSQGLSQTSVQQIADNCEIAQTTVLYHYKSKQGLLFHLIDEAIAHNREYYQRTRTEQPDPVEGLIEFLKSNITWCYQNRSEAHVLLMLFNFTKTDCALKEKATLVIDNGRKIVREFLAEIPGVEDPESLSVFLQQYVNAAMFQILVRLDVDEEFERDLENIDKFTRKLLS